MDLAGTPRCGARSGMTSSDARLWSGDRAPNLLPKITKRPVIGDHLSMIDWPFDLGM